MSCSFHLIKLRFYKSFRRQAEVNMEGQFLVRQIYDDEITYNLIGAAVEVLSKFFFFVFSLFPFAFHFARNVIFEHRLRNENTRNCCEIWQIISLRRYHSFHVIFHPLSSSRIHDKRINFTMLEMKLLIYVIFLASPFYSPTLHFLHLFVRYTCWCNSRAVWQNVFRVLPRLWLR